jgi:hypothetical protein
MDVATLTDHELDMVVSLAGIFFVFGFPVLAWLIHRGMRYRESQLTSMERIEMIRHGINPNTQGEAARADFTVPDASRGVMPGPGYWNNQKLMRGGITLAAIGLAITLGLSFIGLGPWLIGGFVPLFIGLAQILIAMSSGATLQVGPRPTFPPPPAPPPPPADSVTYQSYEGSYTYRPGATQELRPPTPPATRE